MVSIVTYVSWDVILIWYTPCIVTCEFNLWLKISHYRYRAAYKKSCYFVPWYNRTTLYRIYTSRDDHHVNLLKVFLFLCIIPDVLYWCPCTPISSRSVCLCLAYVTYAELRRTMCNIKLLLLFKHGGSWIYPAAITSTDLILKVMGWEMLKGIADWRCCFIYDHEISSKRRWAFTQ